MAFFCSCKIRYTKKMKISRVVEYVFFFGLLLISGYMVWRIVAPFISALALSAIIVTICQPLYDKIKRVVPRRNRSVAAFLTTMFVLTLVVGPIILISLLVVNEVTSFYSDLDNGNLSIQFWLTSIETSLQNLIPGFTIDLGEQLKLSAEWLTGNLGAIFAGTVSTIFIFFISLIGSFYFFRDGAELRQLLVKASPLKDREDEIILKRLAKAVRAVATGTLLVSLIQGSLVAIGFTIFGIDRAILLGSIASLGALMPGIGTTIVTAPAIVFLFFNGDVVSGSGLLIWSMLIVGLVDNLIGPYLISRGNNLHPFIILISVLGGVVMFGPLGFIVGPVIVTLFVVLLEIYSQYVVDEKSITDTEAV